MALRPTDGSAAESRGRRPRGTLTLAATRTEARTAGGRAAPRIGAVGRARRRETEAGMAPAVARRLGVTSATAGRLLVGKGARRLAVSDGVLRLAVTDPLVSCSWRTEAS